MNAVEFDRVSKKFNVHHSRARSFHASIVDRLRGLHVSEDFWALRDVTFAIERGATVGMIGSNGSGKSTALKLMANILHPTSGRVTVRGHVAGLLELGAGFHPDLTGRENVYLFASFHGMARRTVDEQFDSIVDFAEMKESIDLPVRHYSSGMYVRLAFAVAIAVPSEVLLLDEIFAVGDDHFQRKCFDALARIHATGTTIVLVSHSLDLVASVCDRAVWLEGGRLTETGQSRDVGTHYLVRSHEHDALDAADAAVNMNRWGTREVEITAVRFLSASGERTRTFATGEPFTVDVHYRCRGRVERPNFGMAIYDARNVHVTGPNTRFAGLDIAAVEGSGVVRLHVASLPLIEGTYALTAAVYDWTGQHAYDHCERAFSFRVTATDLSERYGLIHLGPEWTHLPEIAEPVTVHAVAPVAVRP